MNLILEKPVLANAWSTYRAGSQKLARFDFKLLIQKFLQKKYFLCVSTHLSYLKFPHKFLVVQQI